MQHAWTWTWAALLVWGVVGMAQEEGAAFTQGGGWIVLDLADLNARLAAEGLPGFARGAPLWGGVGFFPAPEEAPWRWGLEWWAWFLQAEDRALLQTSFLGGVVDWRIRSSPDGQADVALAGGLSVASLLVRKGRALDFDEVVDPARGQLSQVWRWGGWLAPQLRYELASAGEALVLRVGLGWLWTPWQAGWRQLSALPNLFDPLAFSGPPARLGGPFFTVQFRYRP